MRQATEKSKRFRAYKKGILQGFLFALLFFFLLFPWGKAIEKAAEAAFDFFPLTGDPARTKVLFLPPGLQFFDVGFSRPAALSHLKADEIRVHPAFSKWLALKPGVKFIAEHKARGLAGASAGFNFHAEALVWLADGKSKDEEGGGDAEEERFIHIQGSSTGLDMALFPLQRTGLDMSGKIRFRFYIKTPKRGFRRASGEADIRGAGIEIKDSLIKTALGPVNLPALQWGEMRLKAALENGELTVESFRLGNEGEALFARLRGTAELKAGRRVRLSRYDFQLQIDAAESLASDSLMRTLDLFLSNTKTILPKAVRYSARIRGSGRRVPSIEKLSVF